MPKKSNKTKNLTTGLTPSKTPTSNAESDKTYKIFETLKTSTVKLPEIILITAENGETVPCSVDLIKRFSYYFYNLIVEFMEANINNLKEPNKANLSFKQFSSAKVIELTLTWCKYHKDDADNHKYLCDHLYVEWLNPRSDEAKESRKNPFYTEWDTKFFNSIDQDNLVELVNAAFYLKNRKLVEFCTTILKQKLIEDCRDKNKVWDQNKLAKISYILYHQQNGQHHMRSKNSATANGNGIHGKMYTNPKALEEMTRNMMSAGIEINNNTDLAKGLANMALNNNSPTKNGFKHLNQRNRQKLETGLHAMSNMMQGMAAKMAAETGESYGEGTVEVDLSQHFGDLANLNNGHFNSVLTNNTNQSIHPDGWRQSSFNSEEKIFNPLNDYCHEHTHDYRNLYHEPMTKEEKRAAKNKRKEIQQRFKHENKTVDELLEIIGETDNKNDKNGKKSNKKKRGKNKSGDKSKNNNSESQSKSREPSKEPVEKLKQNSETKTTAVHAYAQETQLDSSSDFDTVFLPKGLDRLGQSQNNNPNNQKDEKSSNSKKSTKNSDETKLQAENQQHNNSLSDGFDFEVESFKKFCMDIAPSNVEHSKRVPVSWD